MSDEIPRYGGWYKHSNPNYEDFEMWNSVCEDAEPDWEYRNSQRAAREEVERQERAAARQEKERREAAVRERRRREEKETKELEVKRLAARKEAAREEQERNEREEIQEQKREREAQEEMKREANIAKTKQANNILDTLNQLLAEIRLQRPAEKVVYEEKDAVLGAEEGRDQTSSYQIDRSADAARTRAQILADAFGVKKTTSTDDGPWAKNGKSSDPELVLELDHLEDILRTMAESLRAEQDQGVESEDISRDQRPAVGWSVGCVLM